jgi:hypothetical protein
MGHECFTETGLQIPGDEHKSNEDGEDVVPTCNTYFCATVTKIPYINI